MNSAAPSIRPGESRWRAIRALRYRDFRLMWCGLVVSMTGTWMQIIAQALLALRLTNGSALALGTISLAQASSFFRFYLDRGQHCRPL